MVSDEIVPCNQRAVIKVASGPAGMPGSGDAGILPRAIAVGRHHAASWQRLLGRWHPGFGRCLSRGNSICMWADWFSPCERKADLHVGGQRMSKSEGTQGTARAGGRRRGGWASKGGWVRMRRTVTSVPASGCRRRGGPGRSTGAGGWAAGTPTLRAWHVGPRRVDRRRRAQPQSSCPRPRLGRWGGDEAVARFFTELQAGLGSRDADLYNRHSPTT